MSAILPEEADESQLCEYADGVCGVFFDDNYAMDPGSEYFDGFGEGRGVWEGDQRLFAAEVFDIFERDWLAFAAFLCQFTE